MKAERLLSDLASGELNASEFRHAARKHSAPWTIIYWQEGSQFATLREQGSKVGRPISRKDIPAMKRRMNIVATIEFSAASGLDQPEALSALFSYAHWTDEQIEAEYIRLINERDERQS